MFSMNCLFSFIVIIPPTHALKRFKKPKREEEEEEEEGRLEQGRVNVLVLVSFVFVFLCFFAFQFLKKEKISYFNNLFIKTNSTTTQK